MKKVKKFDLDRELEAVSDWDAYGGVVRAFKGMSGTPTPPCTADNPCLRSGWVTFDGSTKAAYEYVQYTVSGHGAVVTQGLRHAFDARLIAAAPALLRFVRSIAEGDEPTFGLVDRAKALVKEVREPVRVRGRDDVTTGDLDPSDYESRWWND